MTLAPGGGHGDYLVHGVAADGYVRVLCARSTALAEEARARHGLWPVAAAGLGRALTGAALLAAGLKGKGRLQIHMVGDGPMRHITAGADAAGSLRGYVGNPRVDLPPNAAGKLDVGGAVGEGLLHVIKDLDLKEPYRSTLPLVSGEVAEDLAHYLVSSEQTPSVMALGVLVDTDGSVRASGGFIIQLLPGAGDDIVTELENRLRDMPGVSSLVDEGLAPEDVVKTITAAWGEPRWLERKPIRFSCDCSRERFERALISLGPEELTDMLESTGEAELTCRFCSERHVFDADDLRAVLRAASEDKNGVTPDTSHT